MHIKHISHNDLDGYASTILTQYAATRSGDISIEIANILPHRLILTLQDIISNSVNYDLIIITDLAISKPVIDLIMESGISEKILVFDHHELDKSITDIPPSFTIRKTSPTHGSDTCATEIYYQWLISEDNDSGLSLTPNRNMSHFVNTVRTYDTYEFKKKADDPEYADLLNIIDAPRLNVLFHIIDHRDFSIYIHNYMDGHIPYNELTHGKTLRSSYSGLIDNENLKNARYVAAALRRMIITPFKATLLADGKRYRFNHICGIVFAERNGPIIGNAACEANKEIDFCVVISYNQISLYTNRPDVDVSTIARSLGGGGHHDASGFTIPYDMAKVFYSNLFSNIINYASKEVWTINE